MRALTMLTALLCVAAALALLASLLVARARAARLARMAALLDGQAETAAQDDEAPSLQLPQVLASRLVRAGWDITAKQALAILGFAGLTMAIAGVTAGPLAAMGAGLLLVVVGWSVLEYRAAANMKQLSQSMLGFLERIRQLLAVGNSLPVSLQRAVENSPPVIAQALAPTIRRISNGSGVADSIARTAADLDLYELHLLSTAARTNLRFGGSLTAILKNIIENIRRRSGIERELRANTTQIRASAWVLAALPMLVGGIVMLTNRDYARWFLATDAGHKMIVYAVASQLVGGFVMRLIVRTRY